MGSGIGVVGERLGLVEKDLSQVYRVTRRRRVADAILGSTATILAMFAGFATAHSMYYEPYTSGGSYPYMASLASIGVATHSSRRSLIGVAAAMTTGFVLMFAITAAAYNKDPIVIMYNVWGGDEPSSGYGAAIPRDSLR